MKSEFPGFSLKKGHILLKKLQETGSILTVSFLPAVTPRPTTLLRLIWFIWAKVSPISKSGT